jgi:DnaJ-class molecular chaperone
MSRPQERERSYKLVKVQITTARHAFQVLGVHRKSTDEEVGAARRQLARFVHPDINVARDAESLMATVNKAHHDLTTNRARYVIELNLKPCAACKGEGCTTKQRGFQAVVHTVCSVCRGAGVV